MYWKVEKVAGVTGGNVLFSYTVGSIALARWKKTRSPLKPRIHIMKKIAATVMLTALLVAGGGSAAFAGDKSSTKSTSVSKTTSPTVSGTDVNRWPS